MKPHLKNFDSTKDKAIIFVNSKRKADQLCEDIKLKIGKTESIHGDKPQDIREDLVKKFKSGEIRILVATDVLSRGMDVKDISLVINFDFPNNMEEYVHRIGRTGRAERKSVAVSFFTDEDRHNAKKLIEILEKCPENIEIPEKIVEFSQAKDLRQAGGMSYRDANADISSMRGRGRNFSGRGRY